ncbi:MAG: sel1 repeat family protein [Kiritimatiellae bacterium]|nr:sel1 repeat family protein [Kiritimatiellia bacterium]
MRRVLLILFAAAVWLPLYSGETSSDAIIRVLNTRVAGSVSEFDKAVEKIAVDAKAGKPLQQFLMVILSREKDPPQAARLSDDVCEKYVKESRGKIYSMAREKNNSLAWYLIALENNNRRILRHAANLGNVQALNAYATMRLSEGVEIAESNPEAAAVAFAESFEDFTKAAGMGDANALNSLAICHQKGYGCEKSETAAFKYFAKAAELRHPEAVNNMGRFYREGVVVKKNLASALKCFEISSSMGNSWGAVNYASQLILGEGCKKDSKKAVALLESFAREGKSEVMDFLSSCYERGLGDIKSDSYLSLVWKLRAKAARGDENAAKWLKSNKAEL